MMQKYLVVNRHVPEECEPMQTAMYHLPAHLEGKDFLCTCTEGPHGFYMVVEGDTAEEVIAALPPEWRRGSEAYPVEIFQVARRPATG